MRAKGGCWVIVVVGGGVGVDEASHEENGQGGDDCDEGCHCEEEHVEPDPVFSVAVDDEKDGDVGCRGPENAHETLVEVGGRSEIYVGVGAALAVGIA